MFQSFYGHVYTYVHVLQAHKKNPTYFIFCRMKFTPCLVWGIESFGVARRFSVHVLRSVSDEEVELSIATPHSSSFGIELLKGQRAVFPHSPVGSFATLRGVKSDGQPDIFFLETKDSSVRPPMLQLGHEVFSRNRADLFGQGVHRYM